jgi:dCTP deaminase
MVLSDIDIQKYIDDKKIVLDPFIPEHVRPAAIDLTLHENFRVFRNNNKTHIDVKEPFDVTELVKVGKEGEMIIHPREFVLGSTQEVVTLPPDLIGLLEGRSSLGRIGFSGFLTFEMSNISNLPIKLYAGMRVAQIAFLKMSTPVAVDYAQHANKYQDQEPPTPSRIWKDFE